MVHESEFFCRDVFVQIDYEPRAVTDDQVRQLIRTCGLMQRRHLSLLPVITVGDRPPRGGGGAAHRGMPGGPFIRLNASCFQSRWNRGRWNLTLAHECGHIVDWAYDCMTIMRRENRTGWDVLMNHAHSGAKQGPSEHYADAFAAYLLGHRISAERRDALLTSRAMHNRR